MGKENNQKHGPSSMPPRPQPRVGGSIYLWLFLLVMILFLMWSPFGGSGAQTVSYTMFRTQLQEGNVERLVFSGERIEGEFIVPVEKQVEGGGAIPVENFRTYLPATGDDQLLAMVQQMGVDLNTQPERRMGWGMILLYMAPLLFLLVFGWIILNQLRMRGQGMMAVTQSRAKLYDRTRARITFNDVAGTEGAKQELVQSVEFLKDPSRFKRLGGKTPKGVLLVGPPGTGKTLLAKAVAGEANVPFFSTSGSDFVEMFVGIGASRVRKMFEEAKKASPAIIFIDELDSVGRRRGVGVGGGHDEREQTLNQLLTEMDGFEANENVIIMAATNRPDVLDPALLRPGRFDRQIVVNMPNRDSRLMILRIHARNKLLSEEVDLERAARATPGFSGADLENLLNEAALIATVADKDYIENSDIDAARDKIMLGLKREGVHLTESDLKLLAYHEAGHAAMAALLPNTDPLEKVTIVPRGQSMGVTQQLPQEDKYLYRRDYLLDHLAVLMGGRAAEEVVFSTATSGAAHDLQQATKMARKMVVEFGMSKALSQMHLGDGNHNAFLGDDLSHRREYSEATARIVDEEVRRILDEVYQKAVTLLRTHRDQLDSLAQRLIEDEEVSGQLATDLICAPAPVAAARREN
jgi:cell division protease FtsH